MNRDARKDLIGHREAKYQIDHGMSQPQHEAQGSIDQDLRQVVGAGHQLKPITAWNPVTAICNKKKQIKINLPC